jgi:hypothetical protein
MTFVILPHDSPSLRDRTVCSVCGDIKPKGALVCWSCWRLAKRAAMIPLEYDAYVASQHTADRERRPCD